MLSAFCGYLREWECYPLFAGNLKIGVVKMISSDELLRVVAEGLELDLSDVSMDTKSSDLVDWDSLGHLNLLMKLDENFDDISEKVPNLASVSSVKEIYDLIKNHNN